MDDDQAAYRGAGDLDERQGDRRLPLLRRPEHEVVQGVADAGVLAVVGVGKVVGPAQNEKTRNEVSFGFKWHIETAFCVDRHLHRVVLRIISELLRDGCEQIEGIGSVDGRLQARDGVE